MTRTIAVDLVNHLSVNHAARMVDLERAGISRSTIRRYLRSGLLTTHARGVVSLAEHPDEHRARCVAALLAVDGSVLSHQTAAQLLGIQVDDGTVHLSAASGASPHSRPTSGAGRSEGVEVRHAATGRWLRSQIGSRWPPTRCSRRRAPASWPTPGSRASSSTSGRRGTTACRGWSTQRSRRPDSSSSSTGGAGTAPERTSSETATVTGEPSSTAGEYSGSPTAT